jgi:hypothetical protein
VSRLHISGWLVDICFGILEFKGLASHDVVLDQMRSRGQEGGGGADYCYVRCGGVVAKEPTLRRWGVLVLQMVLWMSFAERIGCRLGYRGRIGCPLRIRIGYYASEFCWHTSTKPSKILTSNLCNAQATGSSWTRPAILASSSPPNSNASITAVST